MNEVKKKVTAVVLTTAIGVTSVSALADFDKETSNTDVNDTNITEVTTTPEAVNEPTASPTIEPTASPTEDVAEETSNDLDIITTATFEPKETEVPLRETDKNSSDVSLKNAFEDIIENDTLTKYNDEIATFASSTVIDSGKCGKNLTWTLYEDGLLSITGTGDMYNYYRATDRRPDWETYKDKIKSLSLENDITHIGDCAFYQYSGLIGNLTIPDSVTSIGEHAFYGCSGLTGSLTIPDSVTSIGNCAFYDCSGLTGSLTIPNSVTSIGSCTFWGCSGFSGDLVIPDSISYIDEFVFSHCSGFNGNLIIPNSVTSIGSAGFGSCSGLKGNLVIPNSVTSIGEYAFSECNRFTGTLTIPDTVTSIGNYAFAECRNITDMYLNRKEDSISTGSFPNKVHWAYDLSKCSTQLSKDTFQYTGKPIEFGTNDLSVLSPKGKTLYEGTDYVLSYSNNTNLGQATAKISPPTDGISVNQNSVAFSIEEGDISNATISSIANEKYNGNAHTPNFTVTLNDTVLTKDVDYTVTYTNNTDVGTATVKITGKGNYAGTNSTTFKITAESISNTSVNTIPEQKYMGVAITPIPTITYNGKTLSNNVDYTLSYSNNNRVGTATVTITGKGNFTGITSKNFTIKDFTPDSSNPISLNSDKLKINWDNTSYVYDGNEKKPKPTSIRYYFNDVYSYSLIEGQDFSLSYANNTDAGTGTVTVNGVGGFSNSKSNNFTITSASINNAVFTDIETVKFSGGKLYPNFTVTVDGRELVKNTDYTVEYSNNVQVGTGNIKITGIGNYTGVAETTFTVNPYDPYDNRDPIDMSTLHPTITGTFTYNKAEQKPVPTIVYQTYNNETSTMLEYTLVEGKDYNLTYTNNINAGTATLTATGIGIFEGYCEKDFTINPKSAESLSIDTIGDKVFSGVAQTPDAVIKDID